MIQRCPGLDELTHHAVVPQVGRGDQRGAVVTAGGLLGARTKLQQHAQGLFVVGH